MVAVVVVEEEKEEEEEESCMNNIYHCKSNLPFIAAIVSIGKAKSLTVSLWRSEPN